MSKKSRFRGAFEKQHCKQAQTLLKSELEHLYHIYWSLRRQLNSKKSLLTICKILRFFLNILAADNKYSLLNRDNLTEPIQMQVSQKQKPFSNSFSAFLKFRLNLEHFRKKKMSVIADVFPILLTPEKVVR